MTRLYSKKKPNSTSSIILWIFFISIAIYLFWIIINPTQKGIVGNFIFNSAFYIFGQSIYIFPFIFLYGSIRILLKIGKPNKGIITLLLGSFITMISISSILEHLHYTELWKNAKGGWSGYFIDSVLTTLFGPIGGFIFSITILIVGLNIIFEIRWTELFKKTIEIIKKDWKEWKQARAELLAIIDKAKREQQLAKKTKETLNQTFEKINIPSEKLDNEIQNKHILQKTEDSTCRYR